VAALAARRQMLLRVRVLPHSSNTFISMLPGVVRLAWADRRRIKGNEKFYRSLLANYTVTVEKPI